MKRTFFAIACVLVFATMHLPAQTLNVYTGNVCTAFNANADEMPFIDGGVLLTIEGKTFVISEIDSIIINNDYVADNTVNVTYNDTSAHVLMAGNIAPYMTANVAGANVTLTQATDLPEEVTYTLSGSSDNGSFYMAGKLKATLVLNGITLACNDSAAINIQDGKRIAVELADGTQNVLSDGTSGSQKACFMVKGHTEFKGGGSLTLTGNTKHAFWGGEYVELKKTTGSITITSAIADGMNVNQYFEQKGGTLTIDNTGDDGIQISVTDDTTDELNGQAIISGGTMSIDVTAAGAKGLKCDSMLTISDGELDINTSGTGMYDTEDKDVSSCAAVKVGGDVNISGGTLTMKSTGTGGKGLNADGAILITNGIINATTTGKQYTYSRLSASSKGIKCDGDLTINGGNITVSTTGGEGSEGIESKKTLTISDGEVVVNSYDDGINAASHIGINGGKTFVLSSNNDAIDSNGTLAVGGGLVIACGTLVPEAGFDCDQNTFSVTGGTIIGLGGDTSAPSTSSTTQPVMALSGQQYSTGTYITLSQSGSTTPIFAFCIPQTYREATLLVSDPSLSTGNTYTIGTGATVSDGTEWHGYTTDATISGGSTAATVTLNSMVTSQTSNGGNTGGGPGGGGPGGGGRR